MGTAKAEQYCPHEQRMVLAEKRTPNTILHLVLSVITMGIWLPIWILIAGFGGRYRCPDCGAATLHDAPAEQPAQP